MANRKPLHIDRPLFFSTMLLIVGGLFILASASIGISAERFGTPYFYLARQATGALIGLIALIIISKIPYKHWRTLALPMLVTSMGLLILLFFPQFGTGFGKGATRWLSIAGISFQPAELLKITFIIYLAAWLASRRRKLSNISEGLLPFLLITGAVGGLLIAQPDVSTFAIIAGASVILFFLAGGKIMQILLLMLMALVVVSSVVYFTGYNIDRVLVFLDPGKDPQGAGYQLSQSLIAIGSGGAFGKGFGLSEQKFSRLPEPISDSIFAVFSEELGLFGNIILLSLFFVFIWRGILIASRAPDKFGKLLAIGIVSVIFIQTMINIGAFTGLLPLTGTPLPFVSYGRSALIGVLASVGIIFNISRYTRA